MKTLKIRMTVSLCLVALSSASWAKSSIDAKVGPEMNHFPAAADSDAVNAFTDITKTLESCGICGPIHEKSLAEIQFHRDGLQARGYLPLDQHPASQAGYGPAQTIHLSFLGVDSNSSGSTDSSQVRVSYTYEYKEAYLPAGEKRESYRATPYLVVQGYVFYVCRKDEKACKIDGATIDNVGISWSLPPFYKGGNSSSGG